MAIADDGAHGDEQRGHDDEQAAVQGPRETAAARGIRRRRRLMRARASSRGRGGVAGIAGTGHPTAFSM